MFLTKTASLMKIKRRTARDTCKEDVKILARGCGCYPAVAISVKRGIRIRRLDRRERRSGGRWERLSKIGPIGIRIAILRAFNHGKVGPQKGLPHRVQDPLS